LEKVSRHYNEFDLSRDTFGKPSRASQGHDEPAPGLRSQASIDKEDAYLRCRVHPTPNAIRMPSFAPAEIGRSRSYRADQIAMPIAMRAAQHNALRAIVSRIGHRNTQWPVVASMAFPPI
jgi:hypothetical protein